MPLGYAATWKRLSTNFARAAASLPTDLLTYPFLIMCDRLYAFRRQRRCVERAEALQQRRWRRLLHNIFTQGGPPNW